MKLIGLIGGISPESTAIYYRLLNDAARSRLGAEHSANILLYTVDFADMLKLYSDADWVGYAQKIADAGKVLHRGGVEALAIASNTSHMGAEAAHEATGLSVIHVMDVLVEAMHKAGSKKPLLLGTHFTMSGDFYRPELERRFGDSVLVPDQAGQDVVERIIINELCKNEVKESSRNELLEIMGTSKCDGVILGCTELCMIIEQTHTQIPVFDTTALHVEALSAYAIGEG